MRTYTIKVQTDDAATINFEQFKDQIKGHYIAGNKDYVVKDVCLSEDCLTQEQYSEMLEEQEAYMFDKVINVARQFCHSKDDEEAFAKMLSEEFNQ